MMTNYLFLLLTRLIEKARRDLEAINQGCEMSNSHMIGEIESKLPAIVKKDWIDIVLKPVTRQNLVPVLADFQKL